MFVFLILTKFLSMKKIVLFISHLIFYLLPITVRSQNPNLKYLHELNKSLNSPNSIIKDKGRFETVYRNLKQYDILKPKTEKSKLCLEIQNCLGKKDSKQLLDMLAFAEISDLVDCMVELRIYEATDCCSFEDSDLDYQEYRFHANHVKYWSLEVLFLIKSMMNKFKDGKNRYIGGVEKILESQGILKKQN